MTDVVGHQENAQVEIVDDTEERKRASDCVDRLDDYYREHLPDFPDRWVTFRNADGVWVARDVLTDEEDRFPM